MSNKTLYYEENINGKKSYFNTGSIRHWNKLLNINKNKIYKGTLGSGDVFNREYDRVVWINNIFNNDCEDMESIGCYSVCEKFNIPCVGVRIISNNELLQEEIDKEKAIELQKLLSKILKELACNL